MKIHRPILISIHQALGEIFAQNKHAGKVVESYLKSQKKWGARDRRQFAETVYDTVRWWRRLALAAGVSEEPSPENRDKILNAYFAKSFATIDEKPHSRAVLQSIPDWLDERGVQELGEKWNSLLNALNQAPPVFLRANELKTSASKLREILMAENIATEYVAQLPLALVLNERKNVFKTEAYKSGLFEMQDGGSQLIAPFLEVEPKMRVIDACAGAGGKTLHIAALMQNKGKILALDIHDWKLEELKKRARRAGVSVIETKQIDSHKIIKRLEKSADRLLLDVPCSGLGVLRRKPDTKWKLSPAELARVAGIQSEILLDYSTMVKPGGLIVYATCSILPSENQQRIEAFLKQKSSEFDWVGELTVSPNETNFDGFYAAKLLRK